MKKTEQPDKILKLFEEVLDFNKNFWKQQGLGLKILNAKILKPQTKCLVDYQLL